MNLTILKEMAERSDFEGILKAIENLPPREKNLKDRFLRDSTAETLSGLIVNMTQRYVGTIGISVCLQRKEDLLLKQILNHASKKSDKDVAIIAEGWRNLDKISFIRYLEKFIDDKASLSQNVAFCKKVTENLSEDVASLWLGTLESLDGYFFDVQTNLICYLLRVGLKTNYRIYTKKSSGENNFGGGPY